MTVPFSRHNSCNVLVSMAIWDRCLRRLDPCHDCLEVISHFILDDQHSEHLPASTLATCSPLLLPSLDLRSLTTPDLRISDKKGFDIFGIQL
jgi:hypothetical protein